VLLGQNFSVSYPVETSTGNAITYLVTPSLRLSPDVMTYVRIASGYRPGGPNINSVALGIPSAFNSDRTTNYELGVKGDLVDHKVSIDGSLYYIDWKDLQLNLLSSAGSLYTINASRAKSQGVELSVQARPMKGLTVGVWVALCDAALKEPLPASTGTATSSGDELPGVSKFTGNLTIDEEFPVTARMKGFVGGDLIYVGRQSGAFVADPTVPRAEFPPYARTDLHAGLKYGDWAFNVFANNITDKRAIIGGGPGSFLNDFIYIQPRTIGMSVTRAF
jgi:outer membrane receptor protein involved in Fe transport